MILPPIVSVNIKGDNNANAHKGEEDQMIKCRLLSISTENIQDTVGV